MIRVALTTGQIGGDIAELSSEQRHYLIRVMRLGPQDAIVALTPKGPRMAALIDESRVKLADPIPLAPAPRLHITLAQSLLKGDRFAEVLDRGTQAGIAAFQPVLTRRCVAREPHERKAERWRKMVVEAAEQSGREDIPALYPVLPLDAIKPEAPCVVLMPGAAPLDEVFSQIGQPERIWILCGPEGGLEPAELARLVIPVYPASLGARIFRAENAGAFAAFWLLALSGHLATES